MTRGRLMAVVRIYRGTMLLGVVDTEEGVPLLELAEDADIEIPRNCTSGNCGTCMARLVSGSVPMPDPLPPGLDDYLVEQGAILTCIGVPDGDCEIDLIAPL